MRIIQQSDRIAAMLHSARWFWLLKPPRLCTFLSDCDLWPDRRSALVRAFCPEGPR